MDLIADIGASRTRCALLDDRGRVLAAEIFSNADFTGVEGLLKIYLDHRRESDRPRRAALAIAAPILSDRVRMANIDWSFSQAELSSRLELTKLTVVNDFAAVAWGLSEFTSSDLKKVGGGTPVPNTPMAAIGPGSGLGMATLVPCTDTWTVASGEGGNATLAPATAEEAAVAELIRLENGHCAIENLLSGPGLVAIHRTLAKLKHAKPADTSAARISEAAAAGDPLAKEAQNMFFELLGATAGNLALTVGATGGVFIAGGIIPQLLEPFLRSRFREHFEAKGRYRSYMEAIPTYVITDPLPAFRGLRKILGHK